MHSARTIPTDCCNSQGKLSEHIGDGMIYLYKSGHEFDSIFPIWDWQRLPGTTVEQGPGVDPGNYMGQLIADSKRMPFAGTVSDGFAGLSAMSLLSHGLATNKAV